jgi:glycosyltransferase involved in cell wall biosynthesis
MFLTIAIPSYNRPETLVELLRSIDFAAEDIEVVICEDCAPKREEVRMNVQNLKSNLNIRYFENKSNLGFDENLWELVRKSSGEYIMFMGDDDEFMPDALEQSYSFLKTHTNLGYVLRSCTMVNANGTIMNFRYYKSTCFFDKGEKTIVELFRKSVYLAGFCVKRDGLLERYTDRMKGSLLTQLYFLAVQCLQYKAAYFEVPLTVRKMKNTVPYFGSSENEKGLYIPEEKSVEGCTNFMRKYITTLDFFDNTFNINVKNSIVRDMSKYLYPTLALQRHRGIKIFIKFANTLAKMGYNSSIYFYIYTFALVLFGKNKCDSFITFLKSKLKHTPNL